jgi:hypothetical protein
MGEGHRTLVPLGDEHEGLVAAEASDDVVVEVRHRHEVAAGDAAGGARDLGGRADVDEADAAAGASDEGRVEQRRPRRRAIERGDPVHAEQAHRLGQHADLGHEGVVASHGACVLLLSVVRTRWWREAVPGRGPRGRGRPLPSAVVVVKQNVQKT